jgi:hypothetical protein
MGKLWHPTKWRHWHYNAAGILLYDSGWEDNVVTDEGEAWILDVAFRNTQLAGFTNFEVMLSTSATLSETSAYAARSELADGDGYAAKTVNRNTTDFSAPTGTDPVSITTPATGTHDWTASADWASIVEAACLTTVGLTPNRLIGFVPLAGGAGRDVNNGDTLKVSVSPQAGGA